MTKSVGSFDAFLATDRAHGTRPHVLVPAVDWPLRRPYALIAFEESVSGRLPNPSQPRNVVPESDQLHAQASLFEPSAKTFDLRALAGSIDAGETDKPGSPVLEASGHPLAPNCSLSALSVQWGLLELAVDSATTVPMATPAATMRPTLIRIERAPFCFAGAMAAPAGLDAGTPVTFSYGAAAVPTGSWATAGCCGGAACGLSDGVREGSAFVPGGCVPLSGARDCDCPGAALSACCARAAPVCTQAASEEITRQPAICRTSLDESLIESLSLPAEACSSESALRLHFLNPDPNTQAAVSAQAVFPGICEN
jgi:hypothetical protein